MIKIELTNEDASLFKLFREYQDRFKVLLDNKVFEIKNGKAVLNFDSEGKLRQVNINRICYRT